VIITVPHQSLATATLRKLVEEFVTRDGTDYGEQEVPLPKKVEEVLRLLDRGEVVILFDDETGATHVAPAERSLND